MATALFLTALSAAGSVRADAADDAAKARYAEGTKLYNKRDYEKARVAFLQAAALKKKPAITFMLAECSLKLGHWLEASKGFDQFIAESGEVPPKLKGRLDADKKQARAHLARLQFDVPDGAEILIDGDRVVGAEPLDVAAGPHTVVVTHKDEKKTLEVDAEAGKTTDVHPSFIPKALVPTSDTRTQPTQPPPPTTPEEAPSLLSPPATKWPVYVSGAIGVGGLLSAAIFGGLASNARHGIDVSNQAILRNARAGASCSNAASFDDASKGQSLATFASACHTIARSQNQAAADDSASQVSLVVGIVGMVGALTWFFVAPKEGAEKPETTTQLVPWLGPTGGGASMTGRF